MDGKGFETRDELGAAYLHRLRALALEISVAMEAVSANALSNFQDSVAKQEMLCSSLASMANAFNDKFQATERPGFSCIENSMDVKIRAASLALRELNLQYSALLRHAGRSVALLASLCRSHTGQLQEARGSRLKHQTWSCEM
jgi:hypothetical protein